MRTPSLLLFSLDVRGLYVYRHIVAVFQLGGRDICRYLEDEISVYREPRRHGRRGYALVAREKAAVLRYAVDNKIGLFIEAFFFAEIVCQHEMNRNISVALLHRPRVVMVACLSAVARISCAVFSPSARYPFASRILSVFIRSLMA